MSGADPASRVDIDRSGVVLRIGLLVCDHVMPSLLGVAGDYPDMFARLFEDYPGVELVAYDLTAGDLPESLDECDGWITTGSKLSVYDDEPWIANLAGLVRRAAEEERPFVGICFGHQMLAHALGGEVRRSERGWGVGIKQVDVDRSERWMGQATGGYAVLNSHADQVVVPPPGAEVLGGNQHCPVSLMRVGRHMLGIQGHPEFGHEYSRALMEARRGSTIPESVVVDGMRSLETPPDTAKLSDWIVGFLLGSA